jgi:hypothetical protein
VDTPRQQRSHSQDGRRRLRENAEETPSVLVEGIDEKRQQRSKSAPRMLRSSVSPRVAEATAMLFSKRSESFGGEAVSDLSALNERKRHGFDMSEGKDNQQEKLRQNDEFLERKLLNATKKFGAYSSAGFRSSKKWSPDDIELKVSTAQTDSTSVESRSQEDEGVLSREDSSESDVCLGLKLLSKLDEVEERIISRLTSSSPGGIYRQRTESPPPPTAVEVTTLSSRAYCSLQATMTSSRDASCELEISREAAKVWSNATTDTDMLPSSPSPFDLRQSFSEGSAVLTMNPNTRTITQNQGTAPSRSGLSMSEQLNATHSEAITTSTKTPLAYQLMSALSSHHTDQVDMQTGDGRNGRAISPSTISTLSISCSSSVSSIGIDRPYPLRRVIHTEPFREKFEALAEFSVSSNISESSSTIRTSNHSGHPRKLAASFHSSHLQQTVLRRSSLLRQVSPVDLKQREFSQHNLCPSSMLNTARFSPSLREHKHELPPSSCESTPPISGSKGDSSQGVETDVRPASQAVEFRDDVSEGDEQKKEQNDQQLPCLSRDATVHLTTNDMSHDDEQDFSFDAVRRIRSTLETTRDDATSSRVATTALENGTFNRSIQANETPPYDTISTTDDEQRRGFKPNGENSISSSTHYELEDEKKEEEHESSILQLGRLSRLPFDFKGLEPVVSSALAPNLKSSGNTELEHIDVNDEEVAISWRFQEPYSPSSLNEDSTSKDNIANLQPVSQLEPVFCSDRHGKGEKKDALELPTRQFPSLHLLAAPHWTKLKLQQNSFPKTTREKNGAVKKIDHEDAMQLQRFSQTMGVVNDTQPPSSNENPSFSMSVHTSTSRAKSKLLSIVQAPRINREEEAKLRKAKVEVRKSLWERDRPDQKSSHRSKRK